MENKAALLYKIKALAEKGAHTLLKALPERAAR